MMFGRSEPSSKESPVVSPPAASASYRKAILMMAKLIEAREDATGRHLERIQIFCRLLAERLAANGRLSEPLDPARIHDLVDASPLHDIGKASLPDSILLKPGKLSAEEFSLMKTHTTRGAKALEAAFEIYPADAFLQLGREIARSHHEKWDGSGYPDGLEGEEIPLAARILAVADVYDALTSVRCYKEASSHERSREIILRAGGRHFDPAIVACFDARERDFKGVPQ